jgi:FeS assembly SUF system protein
VTHLDVMQSNASTPEITLEGEAFQPSGEIDREALTRAVLEQLREVRDPEIPVNIVELGLVYSLDVEDDGSVHVRMTLTAPGCPVAGSLVEEVQQRLLATRGVTRAKTELVWEPAWTMERMSEGARLELGLGLV